MYNVRIVNLKKKKRFKKNNKIHVKTYLKKIKKKNIKHTFKKEKKKIGVSYTPTQLCMNHNSIKRLHLKNSLS